MNNDLISKAKVIHDAMWHCYHDRGCVTCPIYDDCEGDVSYLISLGAETLGYLIHERLVLDDERPDKP